MLICRPDLKEKARQLRVGMTDAEQKLWHCLRRRQLHGVQFFRQRPIGEYIVDFYAPTIKLVIELDGSQHQEQAAIHYDSSRTAYLNSLGINVLRFDNLQALNETDCVLEMIHHFIQRKIPLDPAPEKMGNA